MVTIIVISLVRFLPTSLFSHKCVCRVVIYPTFMFNVIIFLDCVFGFWAVRVDFSSHICVISTHIDY